MISSSAFCSAKETLAARDKLFKSLVSAGYATYARIFLKYKFYLLKPDYKKLKTAATNFEKKAIYMNAGIANLKTARVIIIHEILHGWLDHEERYMNEFLKAFPDISDQEFYLQGNEDFHRVINWVLDFHISNEAYGPEEKEIIRAVLTDFFGTLKCLVTEDHQPGWEKGMTLEEMLNKVFVMLKQDKYERDAGYWDKDKWDGADPNAKEEGGGGTGGGSGQQPEYEIIKGSLFDPTTFIDESGDIVDPTR